MEQKLSLDRVNKVANGITRADTTVVINASVQHDVVEQLMSIIKSFTNSFIYNKIKYNENTVYHYIC